MRKDNVLLDKSFAFSLRIIKAYKYLKENQKEYILSKQILRSGTSIGANAEEANAGQSKKDFIAKLQISYKEAHETHYWIRLLLGSEFLTEESANSLLKDLDEIIILLRTILRTAKDNLNKK
jgi:four helix bundle protein